MGWLRGSNRKSVICDVARGGAGRETANPRTPKVQLEVAFMSSPPMRWQSARGPHVAPYHGGLVSMRTSGMGVEQVAWSVVSQSAKSVTFCPATFHRRPAAVPWETKVRFAIPQQEAAAVEGEMEAAISSKHGWWMLFQV